MYVELCVSLRKIVAFVCMSSCYTFVLRPVSTYIHVYVCMCICVYMYMCVHTYLYMYTYMHILVC